MLTEQSKIIKESIVYLDELNLNMEVGQKSNVREAKRVRTLVSRAIRIFHILIINCAPLKGGGEYVW